MRIRLFLLGCEATILSIVNNLPQKTNKDHIRKKNDFCFAPYRRPFPCSEKTNKMYYNRNGATISENKGVS
jgi:hypothetical protein